MIKWTLFFVRCHRTEFQLHYGEYIYPPNKTQEQCSFFDKLQQKLDDPITDQNQRIKIGGDFNVVRDPNLNSSGGSPKEKRSAKILDNICLNYDFTDSGGAQAKHHG